MNEKLNNFKFLRFSSFWLISRPGRAHGRGIADANTPRRKSVRLLGIQCSSFADSEKVLSTARWQLFPWLISLSSHTSDTVQTTPISDNSVSNSSLLCGLPILPTTPQNFCALLGKTSLKSKFFAGDVPLRILSNLLSLFAEVSKQAVIYFSVVGLLSRV